MRLVDVRGVKLEVDQIAGKNAEFPTLVFLHEGLGSRAQWRDFPREVCESVGAPGLVYSRQGYGASDPIPLPRPLSFMHDEARDALPALLHALDLNDVILIGHSDGASIALLYAGAQERDGASGARVHGVAVMAPHVFVEPMCVEAIASVRAEYQATDLRDRLARYHGANVDGAFFGWADAWLDPEFRRWNIESCLPKVRAPLLVVQGESDPYGTLAQVDAIVRGAPNSVDTLILPACGHAPHRERPVETLNAIRRLVLRALEAQSR